MIKAGSVRVGDDPTERELRLNDGSDRAGFELLQDAVSASSNELIDHPGFGQSGRRRPSRRHRAPAPHRCDPRAYRIAMP